MHLCESNLSKKYQKAHIRNISRNATKVHIRSKYERKKKDQKFYMTEVFELDPKSKSFNMAESACCIAFPETEGIGLSSPFFLQIDTFGKLLRYLTNVCYLKLKNSDIWTNSDNLSWVDIT